MTRPAGPRPSILAALLATGLFGSGCMAGADVVSERSGAIVYGADDRVDFYSLTDPGAQALLTQSMVALVPNSVLASTGGDLSLATTWGSAAGLCAGEPFADQPSAAFCSGVLVDWDLILTADHCTRLYALGDFKAVFGYYYREPGQLDAGDFDAVSISEIVAEELDPDGTEPRLDYAWLRLSRPVQAPRRPAAVYVQPPPLEVGDPVTSVGTPGGIPMKWDAGGHAQDVRSQWSDYFIADSDNSAGSSGGGAFDQTLGLLGTTARGGTDFEQSASGCNTTVREPDGTGAAEQFTYAFRAVAGLCAGAGKSSSLCRQDCESPCEALPPAVDSSGGGCSVGPRGIYSGWIASCIPLMAWLLSRQRNHGRRRPPPSCPKNAADRA